MVKFSYPRKEITVGNVLCRLSAALSREGATSPSPQPLPKRDEGSEPEWPGRGKFRKNWTLCHLVNLQAFGIQTQILPLSGLVNMKGDLEHSLVERI